MCCCALARTLRSLISSFSSRRRAQRSLVLRGMAAVTSGSSGEMNWSQCAVVDERGGFSPLFLILDFSKVGSFASCLYSVPLRSATGATQPVTH